MLKTNGCTQPVPINLELTLVCGESFNVLKWNSRSAFQIRVFQVKVENRETRGQGCKSCTKLCLNPYCFILKACSPSVGLTGKIRLRENLTPPSTNLVWWQRTVHLGSASGSTSTGTRRHRCLKWKKSVHVFSTKTHQMAIYRQGRVRGTVPELLCQWVRRERSERPSGPESKPDCYLSVWHTGKHRGRHL